MPKQNSDIDANILDAALGFADHLKWQLKSENSYPKRAAIGGDLQRISDAAELLVAALLDPTISAFLREPSIKLGAGNPPTIGEIHLAKDLRDLAVRARAQIPENGQGRHANLYPAASDGPTAREFCALVVSLVWKREAGAWPGAKNQRAHRICEDLWSAAGGPPHGSTAGKIGSLAAWIRHIRRARSYENHAVSGLILMAPSLLAAE